VDEVMIVLGADTHKRSHTLAAINVATGQVLGDKTVQVGPRGFATLLGWARELDGQRVWALEDCRHVRARWSASCSVAVSASCASRRG
jgi:transposase